MSGATGDCVTEPAGHRRELVVCLAVAAAIVMLQAVVPLRFEQVFDSDQAVYGLMAKHLSELRAFPLFFYGQNYMLGVQSWLAAPLFLIGGPSVTLLRAPIVLLNLTVALGFVWFLSRQGRRPRYALAAALPVVAFTPARALELGAAYGAGIEPYGYVLALWLVRRRPLAFGALLGFGTLHREFTFLALPALALVSWRDPAFRSPRSLAARAGGFAAVWLVADAIKRNVNLYGPPGGAWEAGSVTLGAQTFAQWLSLDLPAYAERIRDLLLQGIPQVLGARPYPMRSYGVATDLEAGSLVAGAVLAVAVVAALARVLRARRAVPAAPREPARFTAYLVWLAVLNLGIYGLNDGILPDNPVPRYGLFVPLVLVALFAVYFAVERSRAWRAGIALALAVWAAGAVFDNGRLVRQLMREPPPRPHREMADYLVSRGIRYARASYWDAYVITFLANEQVIVASTGTVRISAYQAEVEQHASEAVTLVRLPCDGETKVAAWCIVEE